MLNIRSQGNQGHVGMRLSEFIERHAEPILSEWEAFARSIWPAALQDPLSDPAMLRDHAEAILRAVHTDMTSTQTGAAQRAKAEGAGNETSASTQLDHASVLHAIARGASGFELWALVAEYRALRAAVLRLWRATKPEPDANDLDDLTRFNESIDQSLTESICAFIDKVQEEREALLATAQRMRLDAEDANRAKDAFLATLSHELRTPLTAIVGWVEVLRMKEDLDPEVTEGLEVIQRNTRALVSLVEEMLDVARIVSGKLHLERSKCDLGRAVTAGVDALRPVANSRDITLFVELEPESSPAFADATRIQQIVWNLVSNAIKFTPVGGRVWVTLSRTPPGWCLTVRDNGRGISPELLPHVFERFRQDEQSTIRQSGGLGLGLSIVKHIAELHGGSVEASSPGEGKGAIFTVNLPDEKGVGDAAEEQDGAQQIEKAERDPPSPSLPKRLDGIRVMMIDDHSPTRSVHARLLKQYGAHVTSAESAAEALAGLVLASKSGEVPHVLVSDICMPDLDGYDLIREVRRRGLDADQLPAIALTASVNWGARESAEAGYQLHFKKPVDINDLAAAIASLAADVHAESAAKSE